MSKDDKPTKLEPRLRFPEFRGNDAWSAGQLSDLCDINPKHGELPEQFVYIDLESVTQGELHQRNTIERDDAPSRAQRLLEPDDVLFQLVRPYQRNNLRFREKDGAYIASTGYAQLRARVNPVFLYQLVHTDSFVDDVLAHCTGSSYPAITSSDLGAIAVASPPDPAEQRKIADCLGSLDDWIAAETEALAAFRRHKTGLMQQLFPRPGETRPRLRFPEFQDADEWKSGRCRDIATVLQGYGFPEKYQGQSVGDYPFYKVSDISLAVKMGRRYIAEAKNYIDDDILKDLRAKPVPAGTVIFAKIGEAIRSDRRVVTTKPAVIDNNTAGVKARKGKSSDGFLFYLWSNVSLIDHAGGVVPAVSKSSLENVPLTYPTVKAEQDLIADCLASLDTMIAAQAEKLGGLRTHKRGLMQQLFPVADGIEGGG